MKGKESHHVSEFKKSLVKDLSNLMKKKTVMVVSIKGLPSAQFQDLKKKLRENAKIKVTKKSLIDFALDHCGIQELHELVPYVQDSTAMLFSEEDAFIISNLLSENKSPAKAKEGDIAPEDIVVKAGPTSLVPGPDISALSAVGLIPKVESGKISIMQDKVIVKKGDKINQKLASIMAKLEIIPFEIGIEPIAAYMNGKVYNNIKIDKEKTIQNLEYAFSRALPFAIELSYFNTETIDFILAKASIHEKAIQQCLNTQKLNNESNSN